MSPNIEQYFGGKYFQKPKNMLDITICLIGNSPWQSPIALRLSERTPSLSLAQIHATQNPLGQLLSGGLFGGPNM